ncbi:MAG: GntR family transcriptional regulator [Sphingobium sp.]
MRSPPYRSAIDAAADRLRQKVWAQEEGEFLGSEDALQAYLGVSRATVRQAARMLESEGLLRVRRGINGGYFAARPDLANIEKSVGTYLEMLNVAGEDILMMASVLWIEVIRKAAGTEAEARLAFVARNRQRLDALAPDTGYEGVLGLEQTFRTDIFDLIGSRYIELIFHINVSFAHRRFPASDMADDDDANRAFFRAWRAARQMELSALADGDAELGALTARHMRNIWQEHMRMRII